MRNVIPRFESVGHTQFYQRTIIHVKCYYQKVDRK